MSKIIFSERVILVDVLAILFGISSWVEINGIWVETPILVQRLPEMWNLASYIVVITQLANIGPITYSILKFKFSLKSIEMPAIHVTLAIGTVSCLLLALFWDKTADINGSKHSVAALTLTASLAIVDCTTSVLYLPFMAHFKSKYLMSYLMGQGLSGLLPSIVAIIQGIGGSPECVNSTSNPNMTQAVYSDPRFSVEIFFLFLMVMVGISWISFILLDNLKLTQSERVTNSKGKAIQENIPQKEDSNSNEKLDKKTDLAVNSESNLIRINVSNISRKTFITLLIAQAYICSFTNGVLPAIQTYSCLPYGNLTYHLTVTLSSMANPIACFIAFYLSERLIRKTLPLVIGLGTVCAAYIILTATWSPTPPLHDTSIGKIIIAFTWIAFTSLFSYSRACIASIMRNTSTGHKSLFFCGVFTQIGSAFGAIIMFVIVNYTNTFVSYNPCS